MSSAEKSHLKDSKPSSVESWTNPFDSNDEEKHTKKYNNNFRDSGRLENQSVQELESYAVYKAEKTTNSVNNCLKIAENIREDATKTLVTLHQQGEQITRSHHGEKLLGSLGGLQNLETKEDTSNNRPSYCWRLRDTLLPKDEPKLAIPLVIVPLLSYLTLPFECQFTADLIAMNRFYHHQYLPRDCRN
ncbi:hypothetical protein V8G54_016062, partial [Vigna mungo]